MPGRTLGESPAWRRSTTTFRRAETIALYGVSGLADTDAIDSAGYEGNRVVRAIAAALIDGDSTRLDSLGPAIEWLEAEAGGQTPPFGM